MVLVDPMSMTERNETRTDIPAGAPSASSSVSWRIVLDQRTLPLPLLRPVTIGSDERNSLALSHGSVRPFHASIRKRGIGLELKLLDDEGELRVNGKRVKGVLLVGGEEIHVGNLALRVEKGEIAPAVTAKVMAPLSVDQEFYVAFTRELKRTPWFAISIAVHLLLLLWAQSMFEQREREHRQALVQASIDDGMDAMPLLEEDEELATPPERPIEDEDLPEIEPLDDPANDDLHYLEDDPINSVGVGDLRKLGIGDGTAIAGGFGSRGVSLSAAEGPLKGQLQSFRQSGVDVVFLIDTTASMESFLRAAKATIDKIITDLADLVPNARLGVVAYRDDGDEYVTMATPISNDRYAILNFLESLRAKGGGDVPEGVLDAFEHAFDELRWRPNAHRVMILVADAPPHPEDMSKLRMRLRSSARSNRISTTVSSIFTGRGVVSHARQAEAEKALREICEAGGGEFAYLENKKQVTEQLVSMTLGTRFRKSAGQLLEQRRASPRHMLVSQRVRGRDLDWLLQKLFIVPVEPSVVSGLVEIGSPGVAIRCLDLVSDNTHRRGTREAALYVLKRITRYDGSLDFSQSLISQEGAMKDLHAALERAYRETGRRRGG